MNRIYKGIKPKPLIIAPGGFYDPKWFKEFLADTSKTLNVISHHIYNLGPGNFQILKQIFFVGHTWVGPLQEVGQLDG